MTQIPIFISFDNNYSPFAAVLMASILDNTKSFIEFYFLDNNISVKNKEKISSLKDSFKNFTMEYIKINSEDIPVNEYKNECSYVPISTYNRFLIPKLKPGIKKALYLDADIVVYDDILNLFQEDLSDFALGAIPDMERNIEYHNSLKSNLGLNLNSSYFNAGVLVIDCVKWGQDGIGAKLFETEKNYRKKLRMADQDVLNIYFENKYKILDVKYNEQNNLKEKGIRHFSGNIKPWQGDFYINPLTKKPEILKNTELFWKYAKMTNFYDSIRKNKELFLNSNVLLKRFNKIINKWN